MAEEPERPIEKLLRDSGKKRVPPEPLQLHAANRRLLQGEVSRSYAGPKRGFKGSFLGWFPMVAWAGSAALVIAISAWLLINYEKQAGHQDQNLLVSNEKTLQAPLPANAPAPTLNQEAATPPKESAPLLADKATAPALDRTLNLSDQPVAQTDAPASGSVALAEREVSKDVLEKRETAATPPPPPAVSTPQLASAIRDEGGRNSSVSGTGAFQDTLRLDVAQRYVQEEARKAKAAARPTTAPVLVSFQLERAGAEVRIIDRDGSVYTGSSTNTTMTTQAQSALTFQSVPGLAGGVAARNRSVPVTSAQEFFFRVSGTNRTLGQPVVFNGRWSGPVGTPSPAPDSSSLARGLVPRASTAAASAGSASAGSASPGSASRISGRAVVGGGEEITVQAISTQP